MLREHSINSVNSCPIVTFRDILLHFLQFYTMVEFAYFVIRPSSAKVQIGYDVNFTGV